MDKILVTGSTGVVGSYVLGSLIKRGIRPLAALRDKNKLNVVLKSQSDIVYLDYNDLASINEAIVGIDKIFLVPPMDPNMSGMIKNVLRKIKNLRLLVCISASGADANSAFPLLRSHGEIKAAILDLGIPHTFLAPAHFYQNYIEFCSQSIQVENTFYFPQGNAKKSMIDTYDIGEIAAKILLEEGHAGKTYNLAGYDYDNFEIANTISKVFKKEIQYVDINPDEYRNKLLKDKIPEWKIEIFLKLNAAWKAGSRLKSNEETKLLLGREPRNFEEFLQGNKSIVYRGEKEYPYLK